MAFWKCCTAGLRRKIGAITMPKQTKATIVRASEMAKSSGWPTTIGWRKRSAGPLEVAAQSVRGRRPAFPGDVVAAHEEQGRPQTGHAASDDDVQGIGRTTFDEHP